MFTTYQIRHSFAAGLRRAGTDVADIQDLYGHTRPETTMIYAPLELAKHFATLERPRLTDGNSAAEPAGRPVLAGPNGGRVAHRKMLSMERLTLAQPTRYPIEHVCADAVRQLGRKKAIEVGRMHRFLEELGLHDDGILVPGETPDFTYETPVRRIGIEMRALFDNRPIEDAARRERIVTKAQRLVAGDNRFDGLRLWVAFGNAPLPTIKEGSEELVSQVCGLVPRGMFATIEQDRSCLFRMISFFPNDTEAKWQAVGKVESPGELTQRVLQRAVDEKGQKVRQYRRDCTELWLLLVLPLFPARKPASGQLRWPAVGERWNVKTQFDRVFVFEEDSAEPLHEVATVAVRPD